jgi:UDP-N-acetylglucosamine:LPS N-acetylglucosamine transferase
MTVCLITYTTFPLVLYALKKVVVVDTFGMVIRPLVASMLMGVLVFVVEQSFVHGLLSLLAAILFGLVAYSGILYVLDGKYLKAELGGLLHSLLK